MLTDAQLQALALSIDGAADSFALQKIQAKLQAESIAASGAMRAVVERQAIAGETVAAEFKRQSALLDQGGTRRELVAMLFKELVAGYMKPGTATGLDTQTADAKADAQYLGAAMDAALGVLDAQLAKAK